MRVWRFAELRAPLSFTYGNCLFGVDRTDAWAAFAIEVSSYRWLSEDAKRARFLALLGALEAIEADVQIVRLGAGGGGGGRGAALAGAGAHGDAARAHVQAREAYAREHERRVAELGDECPALFVLVSLREPERDVASYVSSFAERGPRAWWSALLEAFSVHERGLLKGAELERARVGADRAHARLAEFLPARPARGVELQWLIRRE